MFLSTLALAPGDWEWRRRPLARPRGRPAAEPRRFLVDLPGLGLLLRRRQPAQARGGWGETVVSISPYLVAVSASAAVTDAS